MINPDYCRLMARYHQWQNDSLGRAMAQLSDIQLMADRRAFFGSILGTLNHLLIVDGLWLSRFLDQPEPEVPLDAILHDNRQDFATARAALDQALLGWAGGVTQRWLDDALNFTALADGKPRTIPTAGAVLHLFNHGTHHRGQATTLLSELGIDPGITDLARMEGLGAFIHPAGN
ncbi:MAG: DinB family protein [Gammaproteobacteria bacterium]|nr:DinB family protein [Gammaproteobacteria bacterium]